MFDNMYDSSSDTLSLIQMNYLRVEALDIFDRCLTEGNATLMNKFIEKQLAYTPPRLELLSDIADDLQQRLLTLREYHFDVREKVIISLQALYGVDISTFLPPDKLSVYHLVDPEPIIDHIVSHVNNLEATEKEILTRMLHASIETARQLQNDIALTEKLHTMLLDWLEAFSVITTRTYWYDSDWSEPDTDQPVH